MKVLIVVTQFVQLGGAERLSVELAGELNAQGVAADVAWLYGESLGDVVSEAAKLRGAGVMNVRQLDLRVHPSVFELLGAVLRLRRMVREGGYSVVESSMFTTSTIASLATLGTPALHLCGVHDEFSRITHRSFKYRLWRWVLRLNQRTLYYAISDYVRRQWTEFVGVDAARVRTVYNGIPEVNVPSKAERADVRRELGVDVNTSVVMFVGRMLKRKGIDTVLEGVGPILESEKACLVFVGGDDQPPEGLFPDEAGLLLRMRERIVLEGWEERIRFLGRRADARRLMAASDVLVHPARVEGFGLVLAEAMAEGCPVVASNVGGIPEVLAGTDSILVPPDDPEAVRRAVVEVLRRPPREAEVAAAKGRQRVAEFSTERRVQALLAICREETGVRG